MSENTSPSTEGKVNRNDASVCIVEVYMTDKDMVIETGEAIIPKGNEFLDIPVVTVPISELEKKKAEMKAAEAKHLKQAEEKAVEEK